MSEKKVVVQVLADTKPFIRSLLRLRKIAESIDGSQIKNSNKLLKSVIQKQKMDDKIQKMAERAAKAQQKASKESEESQERVLKKAIKYGAIVESIRRSYRAIKGGFTQGYDFGRGVVDPARTYGVNLTQATQANALYSAFGGKAGGGADVLGKFLQNRLDFLLYQRGPLKEAAGRFGLNQQALLSGELTDFVREIRRIREERGLSDMQTQGLLQAVGFGGDAAIMRMVTESPEDFEKSLKKSKNIAQSDEERLKAFEETEKSFETMMTNIKTTLMDWATYLKPVIDGFNKLGPTLQTLIASVVAASSALASLGALKSLFSAGAGAVSVGGAGAVAGAAAKMSTLAKLGVGTLYAGSAFWGGLIGYHYFAPKAAEEYKKRKENPKGSWETVFSNPLDNAAFLLAQSSYGLGDLASYLAGHNDEETQNKLAELLRKRNRDNSSEETEKSFETMMTNIKTTLMDWATYLKPVINGFNKLGPTLQTLIASVVAASSALASLGALKSLFSAGAGAGAVARMSTLSKLAVGSLYASAIVGTIYASSIIGKRWAESAADSKRELDSGKKMGYWEHFGHYMNSILVDSAYDLADFASHFAGHNDEETQNKLAELLRKRNRDNSSVDISDLAGRLYNNNNDGTRGRLPELSGIGTRNGTVVEAINVYVSPSGTSDPYTYGERTGGALENAISNMNFFTNGSSL